MPENSIGPIRDVSAKRVGPSFSLESYALKMHTNRTSYAVRSPEGRNKALSMDGMTKEVVIYLTNVFSKHRSIADLASIKVIAKKPTTEIRWRPVQSVCKHSKTFENIAAKDEHAKNK